MLVSTLDKHFQSITDKAKAMTTNDSNQQEPIQHDSIVKSMLLSAIGVLSIALIYLLVQIYQPAFDGFPPSQIFLIASVVLTAVLGMAISYLLKGKKGPGIRLGLFLGFLLHLGGTLLAKQNISEEYLIKSVNESNAQLPVMIDDATRLDSVLMNKETKQYSMTVTLIDKEATLEFLQELTTMVKDRITTDACNNEQTQLIFSFGYDFRYRYLAKDGSNIAEFVLTSKDCVETGSN